MSNIDDVKPDEIYAGEPRALLEKRQRRLLVGGILVILAVSIGVQFLPSDLSRNNPPIIQEPAWDSETTRTLAVRACYDCHSNETYWPWYSYVAPMSWMILRDVHKGREVLNFSEWTVEHAQEIEVEKAVEQISKGLMPLPYYEILHPEAVLSSVEEGQLVNGLIATLQASTEDDLNAADLDKED